MVSREQISTELLQQVVDVKTPEAWLERVSAYPQGRGCIGGVLLWVYSDAQNHAVSKEIAARWSGSPSYTFPTPGGVRLPLIDEWYIHANWEIEPSRTPIYIEDIETTSLLEDWQRPAWREQGLRAAVALPQVVNGQWLSAVSFLWNTSQIFTETDRAYYSAIMQYASGILHTIRLLTLNQEQARRSALVSEINMALVNAQSEEEVLDVIENYATGYVTPGFLMTYSRVDERAEAIEVVITGLRGASRPGLVPGQIFTMSDETRAIFSTDVPLFVENAVTDAHIDENARKVLLGWGNLSSIHLPLRTGNHWQGLIGINWSSPRLITEEEREVYTRLLPTIASVITSRRAYLVVQEAREDTALLFQLAQAINSAFSFEEITNAFLSVATNTRAVSLCFQDVATGQLTIATAAHENTADFRNTAERLIRSMSEPPASAVGVYRLWELLKPGTIELSDEVRASYLALGIHAIGYTPFIYEGGENTGLITCYGTTYRDATRGDRVAIAISDLVRAAVERVRLLHATEQARQETEQRATELEAVAQLSAAATTVLEEQPLLVEFLRLTQQYFAPNIINLYLLNERGMLRRMRLDGTTDEPLLPLTGADLVSRAARERQGLLLNQQADPTSMPARASELAVPLIVRERTIGALLVRAPQGATLTDSQLRVMSTLADLIAVAIQNVRSYRQAHELAALEERTRLARELHDSVSQALYGIALGATTARAQLEKDPTLARQPLDYVISLTQAGLTEMRALIFELRPETLANEGLAAALSKQAASLQTRHGIRVDVDVCEEPVLSLPVKESLYRVAREALHNVIKHAQATSITLRLACTASGVLLEVGDKWTRL